MGIQIFAHQEGALGYKKKTCWAAGIGASARSGGLQARLRRDTLAGVPPLEVRGFRHVVNSVSGPTAPGLSFRCHLFNTMSDGKVLISSRSASILAVEFFRGTILCIANAYCS